MHSWPPGGPPVMPWRSQGHGVQVAPRGRRTPRSSGGPLARMRSPRPLTAAFASGGSVACGQGDATTT